MDVSKPGHPSPDALGLRWAGSFPPGGPAVSPSSTVASGGNPIFGNILIALYKGIYLILISKKVKGSL